MSRSHVRLSDAGLTPRTVTRRDALRIFMGAGLCAALAPHMALAATTQERLDAAQLSYEEAQAELERIGEEYSAIASQVSETQVEIGGVTTQINDTQAVIDDTQGKIDDKQDEISDKQEEIESTQEKIETKQEQIGDRMTAAYKSGPRRTLDLLLSSATFEELTSSIFYLDKVSESEREMIEEVKELKATLVTQRAELEEQKAELESQKAELESYKDDLEELQEQQRAELEDARAKQLESQELVESLSEEVQELMAQRDAELLAAQQAAEEARRREEEAARQPQRPQGDVPVTGSGPLAAVVSACYSTPSPGSGLCAAWVTDVFQNAGIGSFWGNADDMYYSWCTTSTANIQPGMIIAVNSSPTSNAGRIYGHIGIYVGSNTVMHNIGYVASYSLSQWISVYGPLCTPLCGWLGGIALS